MWEIGKTKEEIIELLNSDKTVAEVACLCGVSDTTLRRYRKTEGIECRTRKESAMLGRKRRYKDSHMRRIAFRKALKWVNSLIEMPTEDEIKEYADLPFRSVDVRGMIETRPVRHLSRL